MFALLVEGKCRFYWSTGVCVLSSADCRGILHGGKCPREHQRRIEEPAIMWFIVAANKGGEKTAAHRLIRQPLEAIEKAKIEDWERDISDNKPKSPPQLLVDNFSFEELHSVMKRNGNQTL